MAVIQCEYYSNALCGFTSFAAILPIDLPPTAELPPRYAAGPWPTLYLLHGYSGAHNDWLRNSPVEALAAQYGIAIIMPEGGNRFWVDNAETNIRAGEFLGRELVQVTRTMFNLSHKREDTFIGGLSMGGYGALHTALAWPERFSACIALSSALRIHAIAAGRQDGIMPPAMFRDVFGDPASLLDSDRNPEYQYSALRAVGKDIPAIYLAIGTEDSLYDANQEFRRFLEAQGADFCYEEGPGGHNWTFWNRYIDRGLSWVLRPE